MRYKILKYWYYIISYESKFLPLLKGNHKGWIWLHFCIKDWAIMITTNPNLCLILGKSKRKCNAKKR